MRIKRLDLVGFKSFPDKTTLVFDKPIVGVVGPNGCGKSNIVDAIRWAMGEQSVRALRGASRGDVIFNGTESRPRMAVAEVCLTFDNQDKQSPPQYMDFPEISVTRKLYLSGESEYMINNTPCRLRDITELFLGTGAGNKAYSIIEQGQVARILSAKAEDRRFMIEEAAGITKYFARKKEAERKIASTEQNLLRISDIIRELKKQLGSLSRQAKKAERYRNYKKQLKELDLSFTSHEYKRLLTKTEEINLKIQKFFEKQEIEGSKIEVIEAEINTLTLKMAELEQVLSDKQENLFRLDQQIRLDERNIEVYSEEIERIKKRESEVSGELETLYKDLDDITKGIAELEEEQRGALGIAQKKEQELADAESIHNEAEENFKKHQTEMDSLKRSIYVAIGKVDKTNHKLETLEHRVNDVLNRSKQNRSEYSEIHDNFQELKQEKQQYTDDLGGLKQLKIKMDNDRDQKHRERDTEQETYLNLEEQLSELRDNLTATRSRLDSLAELEGSMEGFEEAVKLAMDEQSGCLSENDRFDVIARMIEVDPSYEKALGAVLGNKLQWLAVSNISASIKGVSFLADEGAGRAGFAPVDGPDKQKTMEPSEIPPEAHPLWDHVTGIGEADSLIKRMLYGILAVDNLDIAKKLWKQTNGAFTFVTTDGIVIHQSGGVVGGSGETLSQSLLRRRREMQELEIEKNRFDKELRELISTRDKQIQLIRNLETDIESSRKEGHEQDMKILEQEKDLHRMEMEIDRASRRIDALEREHSAYQNELDKIKDERHEMRVEREEASDEQRHAEIELREKQDSLVDVSELREKTAQIVTEKRVKLAESAQRRQHVDLELKTARERESDLKGRSERIAFERERGDQRKNELRRNIEKTKTELESRISIRQKSKEEIDKERGLFSGEQEELQNKNKDLKQQRRILEETKETLNKTQLKRSEIILKTEKLEERISERYGITLATEYTEYAAKEEPGEDEKMEMTSLQSRLDKMGEVNLSAISEYDQVSERYQFLCDQEDDLQRSLEALQSAIQKINRTTRRRFKETFEQINTRFSDLFPQMFGGGEARLQFTNPDDLLKTGVEIVAQPPGKNLQAVNLLSGGEKALTALSLVFAIFLYRPTPFCLLDEVDAPLDDVNIGRFNSTVKRISKVSQFILITHNKKTMEITNTLFGVTMEEPGISKIVSVNLT